jgi:hypothetical protein
MPQWFDSRVAEVVLGLSLGMVILGAVLAPIVVARMPADYFVRGAHDRASATSGPIRIGLHWLKNIAGVLLVLAGIAMLVLPGQGVLTVLVGLSLLDFPGKRRLELRLVGIGAVRRVVQAIRRRAGKPPLQLGPVVESSEVGRE